MSAAFGRKWDFENYISASDILWHVAIWSLVFNRTTGYVDLARKEIHYLVWLITVLRLLGTPLWLRVDHIPL